MVTYRFIGRTEALGNQSSEKPVHQFYVVYGADNETKQIERLRTLASQLTCDGDYINLYRGVEGDRGSVVASVNVYRIKGQQFKTLYIWSETYTDDCIEELQ